METLELTESEYNELTEYLEDSIITDSTALKIAYLMSGIVKKSKEKAR